MSDSTKPLWSETDTAEQHDVKSRCWNAGYAQALKDAAEVARRIKGASSSPAGRSVAAYLAQAIEALGGKSA